MKEGRYRGTKAYSLIFSELITAAKYRGTITYQEIAKIIGLPLQGNYLGSEVGALLGEISEDEVENGRPMLSAIAVDTKGKPGKGFYPWAKKLKRQKNETDEVFWKNECKAVYE